MQWQTHRIERERERKTHKAFRWHSGNDASQFSHTLCWDESVVLFTECQPTLKSASQITHTRTPERDRRAVSSDSISAGRHSAPHPSVKITSEAEAPVMTLGNTIHAAYSSVISWKMGTSRGKEVHSASWTPLIPRFTPPHAPSQDALRFPFGGKMDCAWRGMWPQISSLYLSGGKIASLSEQLALHKNVYSPSCQSKPDFFFSGI